MLKIVNKKLNIFMLWSTVYIRITYLICTQERSLSSTHSVICLTSSFTSP